MDVFDVLWVLVLVGVVFFVDCGYVLCVWVVCGLFVVLIGILCGCVDDVF